MECQLLVRMLLLIQPRALEVGRLRREGVRRRRRLSRLARGGCVGGRGRVGVRGGDRGVHHGHVEGRVRRHASRRGGEELLVLVLVLVLVMWAVRL